MSLLLDRIDHEGVPLTRAGTPVATPANEAGLRAVLAHAAETGARVVPIGAGGRLGWCRPEVAAGEVDLLLSTAALTEVLDYIPGDGTLTAQAGCTHAQLSAVCAAGGHVVTPAVPSPDVATLGGTLGAAHSGHDRHGLGPVRHHVLGMRVLFADGVAARTGGKLVKNVTGFDLHRLYTGSRGTLCVILEASLRLFPLPEEVLHLVYEPSEGQLERAARLNGLAVRPRAVVLEGTPDALRLHVTLAGLRSQTSSERAAIEAALGAPDQTHAGAAAHAEGERVRDLEGVHGWPQLVAAGRPTECARMLASLTGLGATRLLVRPGVAEALAWIEGLAPTDALLRALRVQRRYERGSGPRLEPRALPAAFHQQLAPAAGEAPGLRWMLDLQRTLDPGGRFASPFFPGRS